MTPSDGRALLPLFNTYPKGDFMSLKKIPIAVGLLFQALGLQIHAATLDDVKVRGKIICGADYNNVAFGAIDDKGKRYGFGIDICRAVAAAVLGDPDKTEYVNTTVKDRFTVLQSRNIDVLVQHGTWLPSRTTSLGLEMTAVTFMDGQMLMVPKGKNVKSAKQLDGATICLATGSTTEQSVADYFRANRLRYKTVAVATTEEAARAYDSGRCDAVATISATLAADRLKFKNPSDHVILPELMATEPLGVYVRQGDSQWLNVVRWTLFASINAEELGVTKANLESMKKSSDPNIRRLLGLEGDIGRMLGLDPTWAMHAIAASGNYGEMFDRNFGKNSQVKMERGLNKLWNDGGLLYSPPFR